jgi:hypothetical protein
MNPEELLTQEALNMPHRVHATSIDREECQLRRLSQALKEMLREELLKPEKTP